MSLRRQITVLFLLLLPISLFAGFAQAVGSAVGHTNLLQGDPGFEVGMEGWHVYAGPWRSTDLSNNNYKSRNRVGGNTSGPDQSTAYTGKQSARVAMQPDARAYLTATSPSTLDKGDYTFSAYARCSIPTRLQLRILDDASGKKQYGQRNFYMAVANSDYRVTNDWTRVSLPFKLQAGNQIVPIIDVHGNEGSCWFDDLMLNRGSAPKPFVPPSETVATLNVDGPFPTPMPALLFTENQIGVIARLTLSIHSTNNNTPYTATIWTEDPEGNRKQISTLALQLKPQQITTTALNIELPHTGIWKVVASLRDQAGNTIQAETVVATMTPHQGPVDNFFGTQEKFTPLVKPMGIGAVRDMHLLHWADVMPHHDKWVGPDPEEINGIKTFVQDGGLYLATLVSENPAKVGYAASHWGKPDYGGIPQWAQAGQDSEPGATDQVMRAIKPEALAAYAAEAARRYPFLAFEVMNEPLHHLQPDDYSTLLKTAYTAIKNVSPATTVVGMANPPSWFKLPGGKDVGWFGPAPFDWFEQVFEDGGGRYMDAIGIHPYDRNHKNEVPENAYIPGGQAEWARQLRRLAEKDTPRKKLPIWVTEKGITSPSWRASRKFTSNNINPRVKSVLTQARWIVRTQIDMRSHGVERFFLWNQLWSTGSTHRFYPFEDSRYTMFDADGLPRPNLIAQKVLIENLSEVRPVAEGEFRKGTRYALFRSGKHLVAVLWAYGKNEAAELSGTAQTIVCPTLPGASDQIGLFGNNKPYACTGTLKLTPSPIYIRGADPSQAGAWKQALERVK
jgi:hypothetical protein